MRSNYFFLLTALAVLVAMPIQADVMYQCVDESGHKSFSNMKSAARGARCTAMDLGAPVAPSSGRSATQAPANFPKVDNNTQRSRDVERRRILENELATEEKNLEQAKKNLAEQESTILPSERMVRGGISGGKVEERLQPFKDKAALHERNIEAIQKELSRLR